MKTKLERQALVHDYLELLWDGYRSGDFSEVFSHLATDCEMHSQWVFQPNVGYDAIVDYFTEKGNTLNEKLSQMQHTGASRIRTPRLQCANICGWRCGKRKSGTVV